MNQGRIWCVVSPTVGLPLFLGSAALTSLVVHASVLTHSTWFSSFMQGGHKASAEASV
jgi:light-harvesting protein B-800-850 alpha chain